MSPCTLFNWVEQEIKNNITERSFLGFTNFLLGID